MHAIQESQWNQVNIYTWGGLSSHLWEDFRLALYENETEMATQGVAIVQSFSSFDMNVETEVQGVKVVQSPIIMRQNSEMIVNIIVSDRDYKKEMSKYLPLYERNSGVFHENLKVSDTEFRNIEQQLDVVSRNVFIDTAIELLSIYERDLGIKSSNNLNYNQRREQITSRNRAIFDQTTLDSIKSVVRSFSNGDVEIVSTLTEGIFDIKFVDVKGIPDNIDGIKETLSLIMPAHLEFNYAFVFNAWSFIENKTWGEVNIHTWDELRNEVF